MVSSHRQQQNCESAARSRVRTKQRLARLDACESELARARVALQSMARMLTDIDVALRQGAAADARAVLSAAHMCGSAQEVARLGLQDNQGKAARR